MTQAATSPNPHRDIASFPENSRGSIWSGSLLLGVSISLAACTDGDPYYRTDAPSSTYCSGLTCTEVEVMGYIAGDYYYELATIWREVYRFDRGSRTCEVLPTPGQEFVFRLPTGQVVRDRLEMVSFRCFR